MDVFTITNCVETNGEYVINGTSVIFPYLHSCYEYFAEKHYQSPLLPPYKWVFYRGFPPYRFSLNDENIIEVK